MGFEKMFKNKSKKRFKKKLKKAIKEAIKKGITIRLTWSGNENDINFEWEHVEELDEKIALEYLLKLLKKYKFKT